MKKLKMLYCSCHSIAEYDEVKLFKEIGLDVFSHGAYTDPGNPGDKKRPALPGERDDRLIELALKNPKESMSKEFLDNFDIIYFHWMPSWLADNWENMKDKIVIFRTNGQSSYESEQLLSQFIDKGLKIVRYSPAERTIPFYAGEDALIRFYKDPDEFKGWDPQFPRIINFTQNFKERAKFCNFDLFDEVTKGLPRQVFGPDNDNLGDLSGGCLSYDDMKQELRQNAVYFYTGTFPASYTLNFIEALMTGIPIVAAGPKFGNAPFLAEQHTYEIPYILRSFFNGFWSDDTETLRSQVELLLQDKELAFEISAAGRQTAIDLFGKPIIKKLWTEFFERL